MYSRLLAVLAASAILAQPQVVALKNFSIIEPGTGTVQPEHTVIIRGGRIEAVGPAKQLKVPRGAEMIESTGKAPGFLIPGLIDAHVHLVHQANIAKMTPEELLPFYLAHGVTSLRDAGDEVVAQKMTQKFAFANDDRSPRIFLSSPMLDSDPPFHRDAGWALTDLNEVADMITGLRVWGVSTLKLYIGIDRKVAQRVILEGHKAGITVSAHLARRYPAQDAVADGVDVIEHINSLSDATVDFQSPAAVALRTQMARQGTAVTPTLTVLRNSLLLPDDPATQDHPDNRWLPPSLLVYWQYYQRTLQIVPNSQPQRKSAFAKYKELTGLLFKAGVPLLAGTDSPHPFVAPGGALHQELELLVESGLTPAAALAAATTNVARVLKVSDQVGRIAPGMLADIVVLKLNPLEDIRNTRKIALVIRGGLIVDPGKLLATSRGN